MDSSEEVREYYRTVGRFLELELRGRDDAAYWRRRAVELGRPRILELGAGTGRVTRALAPLAELVVAVDLSPDMLRRARSSIPDPAAVRFVVADMRELDLDQRFDLVLAANDPFTHIPGEQGRDRAVRAAARHLAPGGLFVIDALWLGKSARRRARRAGGWERVRALEGAGGELRVRERWTLGPEEDRGRVEYEYRDGDRVVGRAAFRPRLFTPREIERRLGGAGLRLRRLLGDYRENPWDPRTATTLLAEAERAGPTHETEEVER